MKKIKMRQEIGSKGRKIIEEEHDYQLRDRQVKYGDGTGFPRFD